jgi:hypothetical protein
MSKMVLLICVYIGVWFPRVEVGSSKRRRKTKISVLLNDLAISAVAPQPRTVPEPY